MKYFACSRSLRTKQRCWILEDLVSKHFVNKKKKEVANIFCLSIISSGANFLLLCHSMKKPSCEWLDEHSQSSLLFSCQNKMLLGNLSRYTNISMLYAEALVRWYMDFFLFETTGFQLGMLTVYSPTLFKARLPALASRMFFKMNW